jgi:hypothetical protein
MVAYFNVPADVANPVCLEVVEKAHATQNDGSTQEIVNVYHLTRIAGSTGGVGLAALGATWRAFFDANLSPLLSATYIGDESTIRILDDPTSLALLIGTPANGGVAGDALPSFAAVSMDIVTDARGRCFRGRKHYGPIAESAAVDGELSAAAVTAWLAYQAALQAMTNWNDGAGNFYALSVLSRINSNLIGPSPFFTYAVMKSISVSERLGTMKRRKEGVGA